ncbi:Pentatricopeptide repeat-containing protein [Sesamum alatum]|uniref:Pentatricopeptide repeat-containing protein n=1 Tax=Sesamum alatum TaxID=300844 RepID=A0AAE1XQP5_9LAMI|nr:Pentatricopeptide repeat-containing protein [Sesamum alatum]
MACLLSRASLRRPFMLYFCSHLSTFNHSFHMNPDFTSYFISVLPFCRKSRDLEALKSLLIVHGLISHQPLVKHFIDQCCLLGFPNLALSAFKTIEKPSLYLQNLVLRSLSYDGLFEDVMFFYRTCRNSGFSSDNYTYPFVLQNMHTMSVKPNASTFASVFPVCSRIGVDDVGISLHGLAHKLGYTEEEPLVPALISMYANSGDLLAARHIFDTSTRNNVAIWNAIISAYTRNHRPEDAVPVFQAMLRDDMKPNLITFVSLLPSSENLGSIYVESFHAHVVKFGFEEELSVVTALLSVYAKLGNMDSAEFLFHNIHVRNFLFWNSMVSAYAGHGLWEQSLEAFRLMQKDGFVPDAISIVSLLSSCSELSAILLGKSAHAFSIRKGIDINLNASNALLAFYCGSKELEDDSTRNSSSHVSDDHVR